MSAGDFEVVPVGSIERLRLLDRIEAVRPILLGRMAMVLVLGLTAAIFFLTGAYLARPNPSSQSVTIRACAGGGCAAPAIAHSGPAPQFSGTPT